MRFIKNLFKKTCFVCDQKFKSRKSDTIHVKTNEGIMEVDVCKNCADQLEKIRMKDLK